MKFSALVVAATVLALVSTVLATRETGDGSIGGTNYHSDNISDAHDANGTCRTYLSSSNSMTSPKFQIAPFPIAAAAGATGGGSLGSEDPGSDNIFSSDQLNGKTVVYTRQTYAPNLIIYSATVEVFSAKKSGNDYVLDGNRSNPVGAYGANCHIRVPPPRVVTTPVTLPTVEIRALEDNLTIVDIDLDCSMTIDGSTKTYTYTVTNNMARDVDFSWPAVRTGDHPNGWSGTVEALDSVTHQWQGTGGAVEISGHSTDLTFDDTDEVFAAHSAGAVCPSSYVTQPSPVTSLSATYNSMPTRVNVSWTNQGTYDEIHVHRHLVGTADEDQAWIIAGSSTSFVDLDPPSGTVEYTVYAVVDDVAALVSNPTDDATVP